MTAEGKFRSEEHAMGRGAKIFFLSALAAGCIFGLMSFLIISSVTAGGTAKPADDRKPERSLTVFCLDENDALCSMAKITVGERTRVDITFPDAKTTDIFCTRGYAAVLESTGAGDHYAIVPCRAFASIASETGVVSPSSLTDEGEVGRFFREITERLLRSGGEKVFGRIAKRLDTDLTPEALYRIIESRKNIK